MIKKTLLFSVIISQLIVSCSSNDEPTNAPEGSLTEQIANIIKQPYSKLTPAEQKVKLEAEANVMLVQMDKSKTSGAIEAIQNLEKLLINSKSVKMMAPIRRMTRTDDYCTSMIFIIKYRK